MDILPPEADVFRLARENSPAIIFIDEIDTLVTPVSAPTLQGLLFGSLAPGELIFFVWIILIILFLVTCYFDNSMRRVSMMGTTKGNRDNEGEWEPVTLVVWAPGEFTLFFFARI